MILLELIRERDQLVEKKIISKTKPSKFSQPHFASSLNQHANVIINIDCFQTTCFDEFIHFSALQAPNESIPLFTLHPKQQSNYSAILTFSDVTLMNELNLGFNDINYFYKPKQSCSITYHMLI